jgi:hypothetical protein
MGTVDRVYLSCFLAREVWAAEATTQSNNYQKHPDMNFSPFT